MANRDSKGGKEAIQRGVRNTRSITITKGHVKLNHGKSKDQDRYEVNWVIAPNGTGNDQVWVTPAISVASLTKRQCPMQNGLNAV